MSSRSERERRMVIEADSPLAKHSINQRNIKSSLEGERKLGIKRGRGKSQFSCDIDEWKSDELFMFFFDAARKFDQEGLPVNARLGLFVLGISSYINARLKKDPQAFLQSVAKTEKIDYKLGSPFEKLIPIPKMASSLLKKLGIDHKPNNLKAVYKTAGVFAYNFGALNFAEGEEAVSINALAAINNISLYLAREITEYNLPTKVACQVVMVFGETTNQHLQTLKLKKNFRAKRRR